MRTEVQVRKSVLKSDGMAGTGKHRDCRNTTLRYYQE
jgi:hypothetical protein